MVGEQYSPRLAGLLAGVMRLRGLAPRVSYEYGETVCAHCGANPPADGQEVRGALATARGIYMRLKVPCKCGRDLAHVSVAPDLQDDAA